MEHVSGSPAGAQLEAPEQGAVEKRGSALTILVPLDGSERAARALPIAEALGHQLGATLLLMRVSPVTLVPFGISPGYIPPDTYQQMVNDQDLMVRNYLQSVASQAAQQGVTVRTLARFGDAATALLEVIPTLHISMVALTTHGRTGLARFTLGSVADRLVRGGGIPVLLLRSFSTSQGTPELRSALVPLDGSPLSEAALFSTGLLLAGRTLRQITLARTVDPRDGPKALEAAEAYLDQTRRRFIERLDGRECAVETRTQVGPPAASILALARERAVDLILMSTHGEGGIGRLAFGNITDRILRDGETPLLLVPPPKAEPKR